MPKVVTRYICEACGSSQAKWSGRCDSCGAWNSLSESSISTAPGRAIDLSLKPTKITDVKSGVQPRMKLGVTELDELLGGGIVPGSVVLLSGDPGVGKSTLALQIAMSVAKSQRVLYVSGEETAAQIRLRADRLNAVASNIDLLADNSTDAAAQLIGTGDYGLVLVDSIQTMASEAVSSASGTVSQITAGAQLMLREAKKSQTALLIIGHVTKEGNIAGPKILEHLVDVVLYFEGERFGGFKVLKSMKNRFGATHEVALLEMAATGLMPVANPSAALLEERRHEPGSVVFATMEGSRSFLVEVQALVSPSNFGYPKRTAVGIDLNRLNLLIAVLSRLPGYNLNASDVYVNIVGGLKLNEPAIDLAIILAIASSLKQQKIAPDLVVFGEVGLGGEVRSVSQIDKRLREAKKMGFRRALSPGYKNATVVGVKTVIQAVSAAIEQPSK